jgi:hypothetical protein
LKIQDYYNQMDIISRTRVGNYDKAKTGWENSIVGCSVAGGIGTLALIGFGVSFAF